jgi:hypothetical protein
MALRLSSPARRRTRRLLAGAATAAATLVAAGATPADAATCQTAGHAYLTQPGRLFLSGFEGNVQNGVPTAYASQGVTSFRVGGNGIKPGTRVIFQANDQATGAPVPFFGNISSAQSNPTGNNCVANETAPITVTAAPGTYRITALYISGNSGQGVSDPVVDVVVSPPPPPPDPYPYPDPYDPNPFPILY